MPPETKRLLDDKYQGNMHSACREHNLAHQSIKDIYTKNPPGIRNAVQWLMALGFDETNDAMKVLLEMSGQSFTVERKIPSTTEQNSYVFYLNTVLFDCLPKAA